MCRQEDSCGGTQAARTETNQSRQVHEAEDREEANLALLTDQKGLRRDMQACSTGFKWKEVRLAPRLLAQVRPGTLFNSGLHVSWCSWSRKEHGGKASKL